MTTKEKALQTRTSDFGLSLLKADQLTPAKAREGLQLSGLKKKHGEKVVHGVFLALLVELTDFVECKAGEDTLAAWAYKLQNKFWRLKLGEVVLALDMGANLRFGKIYGSLKYQDLVDWLTQYEALKTESAISRQTQHKEAHDGERQALQGIKKLIGKTAYNDKFNK
jgi:hypothetical protein